MRTSQLDMNDLLKPTDQQQRCAYNRFQKLNRKNDVFVEANRSAAEAYLQPFSEAQRRE